MDWLITETGSGAGRRIDITRELVVGRSGADVDIDDAEVSRRHAIIRPVSGEIEVEDLGSTNGTWVNEQRLSGRTRLKTGDAVRVGSAVLRVASDRVAPSVIPPPPGPRQGAARVPAAAMASPVFASVPVRRRPATRSGLATALAIAIIVADAIALIVYFASR